MLINFLSWSNFRPPELLQSWELLCAAPAPLLPASCATRGSKLSPSTGEMLWGKTLLGFHQLFPPVPFLFWGRDTALHSELMYFNGNRCRRKPSAWSRSGRRRGVPCRDDDRIASTFCCVYLGSTVYTQDHAEHRDGAKQNAPSWQSACARLPENRVPVSSTWRQAYKGEAGMCGVGSSHVFL